jgi:hypothetical protein
VVPDPAQPGVYHVPVEGCDRSVAVRFDQDHEPGAQQFEGAAGDLTAQHPKL